MRQLQDDKCNLNTLAITGHTHFILFYTILSNQIAFTSFGFKIIRCTYFSKIFVDSPKTLYQARAV